MPKAVIVRNPLSRTVPRTARILAAIEELRTHNWTIELHDTEYAGHAVQLAREAAANGVRTVFACGGDGTINEVANGLAGTDTSLAVLRGGMGNVFAKEIGVPASPRTALRVLLDGEVRRVDLGVANGRYFLLMAGIGFDARVVRNTSPISKKVLGRASHVLYAVTEMPRYRSEHVKLIIDGQPWEGDLYWSLLGNTRSYGGVLNITEKAQVDDGLLDIFVFAGKGVSWLAPTALRLLVGKHEGARNVISGRIKELVVETPGLPVQADGDYFGDTPMRFTVEHAVLNVLMPRGKGRQLFSQP